MLSAFVKPRSGGFTKGSYQRAVASGFLFFITAIGLHPIAMHPVLVAWKRRDAVSVMTPTAWRSVATTKTSSYTDYQRLAHDTGRSTIGIRRFASSRPFLTGVNEHGQ
jgi:hypothetical protein